MLGTSLSILSFLDTDANVTASNFEIRLAPSQFSRNKMQEVEMSLERCSIYYLWIRRSNSNPVRKEGVCIVVFGSFIVNKTRVVSNFRNQVRSLQKTMNYRSS